MTNILQTLPFYLNQAIGTSETSFDVKGLKDSRGNYITAMPSGVAEIVVTIEPRSPNNQEIISFTGITNKGNGVVTLTGVTRNLNPVSPFTAMTPAVSHANGVTCVISNSPQVFEDVVMTDSPRTVSAVVTFNASPVVPNGVNPTDAVNKSQLDAVVAGSIPASSTTVYGSVRMATSQIKTLGTATMTIASPCVVTFNAHGLIANDTVTFTTTGALPTGLAINTTYYVMSTGLTANTFQLSATSSGSAINTSGLQSGTHTLYRTTPYAINDQDGKIPTQGENDALVGNNTDVAVGTGNKFVTQTGLQHSAETYAVDSSGSSTAYVVTLSPAPTSYTAGFTFTAKLVNANTTTTPTINVNGLGAKTIVKGVNTAMVAGDISANQLCTFVYDGTNMVIQNIVPLNVYAVASANAKKTSTTVVTLAGSASTPTTLAKQMTVYITGTVRVSLTVDPVGASNFPYAIYKNGILLASYTYGSGGAAEVRTLDTSVVFGDLIQAYWTAGGGNYTGITFYANDFSLSYDLAPLAIPVINVE